MTIHIPRRKKDLLEKKLSSFDKYPIKNIHETLWGVWKAFNNYEFTSEEVTESKCYYCRNPAEGIATISKEKNEADNKHKIIEYFCRNCVYMLLHEKPANMTSEEAAAERKIFWLREMMTR